MAEALVEKKWLSSLISRWKSRRYLDDGHYQLDWKSQPHLLTAWFIASMIPGGKVVVVVVVLVVRRGVSLVVDCVARFVVLAVVVIVIVVVNSPLDVRFLVVEE